MIEYESNSEKALGLGLLTLAELTLIAIGAISGGAIGASVGAIILPAIAIGCRLKK